MSPSNGVQVWLTPRDLLMLVFCLLSNLMHASSSGECGLSMHECARHSMAWWVCMCGVVVAVVIVSLTNMITMSLFDAQCKTMTWYN